MWQSLRTDDHVVGTPFTHISYHLVDKKLYVFSVIDNLMKGAASQAVENLNRLLDLPATSSLTGEDEMSPGPGLHVTPLPLGFFASGVNCGVRRYRPDLGLILHEKDCVAAGVFTLNEAKGCARFCIAKVCCRRRVFAPLSPILAKPMPLRRAEGVNNNLQMVDSRR